MRPLPQENTALLIIDVQTGLFEHRTPVYAADNLLEKICGLAERAAQAGMPVFYIQHANKNSLAEGSPAFRLHPALQPRPEDGSIVKRHGSALEDTPLEAELHRRGVTTLVVTGLVTHGCVKATVQDALQRGFRVILVSDAHSSYSADAVSRIDEWNARLSQAGAELWPAEELLR
jgi:nicotinamidase-related amidase